MRLSPYDPAAPQGRARTRVHSTAPRPTRHRALAFAVALVAAAALPGPALADNIHNDILVEPKLVAVTAGASATVGYYIGATGGACDAADGSAVTVTPNIPAGATGVSKNPSSVTFSTCGSNTKQSVTFSTTASAAVGDHVITVSHSDSTGEYNPNPATFTLRVTAPTPPADATPPVVTVPTDMTVEATSASGAAVSFSASANDDVDGALTPTCTPASGSTFALGETTVTCSATDQAGNTGQASFKVTVVDTTAPQVTVPADITQEATSASGAAVSWSGVSASDAVDGDLSSSVSCNPASGSTFPLGETTVTCSVTDNAGNAGQAAFKVTVVDTTAPTLNNVPSNMNVAATSTSGATVNYATPTASDLVDPNPTVACTPASGSTFPLGTTTVACAAEDASGNAAQATFDVTVAYSWSGPLSPVNGDGSSVFKLGSTVPVKFALTGDSAGITNLQATIKYQRTAGPTGDPVNEPAYTAEATGGTQFRYSSGQYVFNWGTKGLQAGVYAVTVDMGAGDEPLCQVTLKR